MTEAGSSGLSFRDFDVHTVREGRSVMTSLGVTSATYTTDASLISGEWSFFTGTLSTDTNRGLLNYPGNDTVFARVNDDVFNAADIQATFEIDRVPDTTEQTVDNATIFLGSTSYTITGIRTVSATDSDVNFILDGSTRSSSGTIAGSGGITLRGLPMGAINTDIPDHPGAGNPLPPISFDNFYNANDGSNN